MPWITLERSSLSLCTRYGFNSFVVSSLDAMPAMVMRLDTTELLTACVTIHRPLAAAMFVKEAMPVSLEAASLFTINSSVMSTADLEKGLDVRRMLKSPASRAERRPG